MRRDLWLGLIGVVVLAGCEKPKVESTEAPVTETPAEAVATPPPVASQATPIKATPAPVVSAGPKLEDEVYLVRRLSIPIDGGMRGFREGSKVKVVAIEGSKLTVLGNEVQFDVQAADVSVSPPVVQSAPLPAASSTAADGAPGKPPAPTASEIEKKKLRNNISAEIANLQITYNRLITSNDQLQAKIKQIQAQMYSGSRSANSPEGRVRAAEVERLLDVVQKQTNDASNVQKAMRLKERELNRVQ